MQVVKGYLAALGQVFSLTGSDLAKSSLYCLAF